MPNKILATEKMGKLVVLVEEAARATEEGVKHFVEPAPGTLKRAISKRHHIVFGRRGSGKSSLLRKVAADLTVDRRPIAYVNLEGFKGHSYPDVLLSVLITTFQEFLNWMTTAAIHPTTRKTFWSKLFGSTPTRRPFKKSDSTQLALSLEKEIEALKNELYRTDESQVTLRRATEESDRGSASASASTRLPGASTSVKGQVESAKKHTQDLEEKFTNSKTEFIHRHILDYQRLFDRLGDISGGDSYLILDDLYHIRRVDQARVVDYFHRIAKDYNLWLKIGTIRHRSRWYVHGDPPVGMKIGDDADEIDLDLTLEKYSLTKEFLVKILSNFTVNVGIPSIHSFLTDGAIDRLVLASGGVARDFLSIFRRSVDIARERDGGHRGDKVGAEDVNVAAGEYDTFKREEFKRDTFDDETTLEDEFQRLRVFCLEENNTNCFLLDKEQRGHDVDLIHELVDLKLIHLVRSRVTVSDRSGRIYEAYMLDLSQYTGSRKRRELDLVEFWKTSSKEKLRKASLIFTPDQ